MVSEADLRGQICVVDLERAVTCTRHPSPTHFPPAQFPPQHRVALRVRHYRNDPRLHQPLQNRLRMLADMEIRAFHQQVLLAVDGVRAGRSSKWSRLSKLR